MKIKHIFFLFTSCLLIQGCASGPISYGENASPTPADSQIEVINMDQLSRQYVVLGEVHAGPMHGGIENAKREARELGADAISIPKKNHDTNLTMCYAIKYKS